MLEYLSVIVCFLVVLGKTPTIFGTLTLGYAASGSCLQVLTAAKLVFYEVYEISYLEATECEKELALARIADIFGLNNCLCTL